jgi:thiamine biosynthesis lipoprotein
MKNRDINPFYGLLTAAAIFCLAAVSCTPKSPGHVKHSFFRMDTVINIIIAPPFVCKPEQGWVVVDSLLKEWEDRFSQNSERSEIGALNQRDSCCAAVSPQLKAIVEEGISYGDSTGGWFDFTILPLKELWGLGETDTLHRIPSRQEISQALEHVGYRTVHVMKGEDRVCVDDFLTRIDVASVAKGFALREVILTLAAKGFKNFLVEDGGDIMVCGKRGDGQPWNIGIQHPRDPSNLLATFRMDSGCVMTSGDYQHFWMNGNTRIHHIFNPFTGHSTTENQSVTMWGMDPVELDMLTTGLFGKSADDIVAYVEDRPRLECLVVDSAGGVHISRGWRDKICFTFKPKTGVTPKKGQ